MVRLPVANRESRTRRMMLSVTDSVYDQIEECAASRGERPAVFARTVVETVVQDMISGGDPLNQGGENAPLTAQSHGA